MFDYVIVNSWWHSVCPVSLGYQECDPGHRYGPAVRSYYLLHYILQGEGDFYRDGIRHHLTAGDIFVIRPGEVTTYQASFDNPWHYSWLGFQLDEAPSFLDAPVIRQPPVRSVFERIPTLKAEEMDGKAFVLSYDLLCKLSRSSTDLVKWRSRYAEYAKAYIDANYMQNVSIQQLADTLHIDRHYLTGRFRQEYGVPPQEYLIKLRLERAQEFLRGGHSVSEVATMVGFRDLPGFSRHYKSFFGHSPSQDHR